MKKRVIAIVACVCLAAGLVVGLSTPAVKANSLFPELKKEIKIEKKAAEPETTVEPETAPAAPEEEYVYYETYTEPETEPETVSLAEELASVETVCHDIDGDGEPEAASKQYDLDGDGEEETVYVPVRDMTEEEISIVAEHDEKIEAGDIQAVQEESPDLIITGGKTYGDMGLLLVDGAEVELWAGSTWLDDIGLTWIETSAAGTGSDISIEYADGSQVQLTCTGTGTGTLGADGNVYDAEGIDLRMYCPGVVILRSINGETVTMSYYVYA